jgi:hypothetical protein
MWQTISDTETLVPGRTYRAVMDVRMAYPAFVPVLQTEFRFQSTLNGDFTITKFGDAPPLWDPRAGKYGPFVFWYEFTVNPKGNNVTTSGLDPWVILSVLALVVGSITALALADKHLEKLIADIAGDVSDLVHSVTPSFVAVGVIVVIALIMFKGGR